MGPLSGMVVVVVVFGLGVVSIPVATDRRILLESLWT